MASKMTHDDSGVVSVRFNQLRGYFGGEWPLSCRQLSFPDTDWGLGFMAVSSKAHFLGLEGLGLV